MSLKSFLRITHGIITVYFGICIGYIYYCFFTNTRDLPLTISLISVWVEFVVLYGFNKGQCPMFQLHEKVGDKKLFFELFMPKKFAVKVIPVVGVITFIGSLLLIFQYFNLL